MSTPPGDDSSAFHEALRRITETGTPVKIKPYRQIWRFEHKGRAYFLKWFPRSGHRLKRLLRGDPARYEFNRLVQLQKAKIPAPHADFYLSGMMLGGQKGDAVVTRAIEPATPLDKLLHGNRFAGTPLPRRRELFGQVITLLQSLAKAGLGHSDLHFGNFLLHNEGLYLLDPSALHDGGLTLRDISVLAHASRGFTTRTERLRAWRALTPRGAEPPREPMAESVKFWSKRVGQVVWKSEHTDRITFCDSAGAVWTGTFFKHHKFPHRYARASALHIRDEDWQRELPKLFEQLRAGLLKPLKRSQSAEVYEASAVLAGVPLQIVIKRPKRKHAYRYVTELGRGSRAYRAWRKSWMLALRNIPVAWPLLYLERKVAGVVVDQYFVAEKVEGTPLTNTELAALPPEHRRLLFRRMGKLLRDIDETKIVHFDTKGSNFIIRPDPLLGPVPVAIDPDGVRSYSWRGFGLARTLRSLREDHPEFSSEDELALRLGYDFTLKTPANLKPT